MRDYLKAALIAYACWATLRTTADLLMTPSPRQVGEQTLAMLVRTAGLMGDRVVIEGKGETFERLEWVVDDSDAAITLGWQVRTQKSRWWQCECSRLSKEEDEK